MWLLPTAQVGSGFKFRESFVLTDTGACCATEELEFLNDFNPSRALFSGGVKEPQSSSWNRLVPTGRGTAARPSTVFSCSWLQYWRLQQRSIFHLDSNIFILTLPASLQLRPHFSVYSLLLSRTLVLVCVKKKRKNEEKMMKKEK